VGLRAGLDTEAKGSIHCSLSQAIVESRHELILGKTSFVEFRVFTATYRPTLTMKPYSFQSSENRGQYRPTSKYAYERYTYLKSTSFVS
jgi:hypothetical protein